MMNIIWASLFLVGLVVAAATGHMSAVTTGIFRGAQDGVSVSIGLISIVTFWLGIMKIAEAGGLIAVISRAVRPLVRWLYPSVPVDHPAMGALVANMSANILGLGNAATPLGLRAMRELQTLSETEGTATDAMCTLLALNTASLTVIPATMIGIRLQFQSRSPADIVLSTILATLLATAAAVVMDRWFRRRTAHRR
ncbi:MAG: spore maturation protein [Firmicutes bacterium]|nr:spore maturation protein [Bacillota bacterium]